MPWKESTTMDLRVRLIQDYNEGHSISALAEIHEVSPLSSLSGYDAQTGWRASGMPRNEAEPCGAEFGAAYESGLNDINILRHV